MKEFIIWALKQNLLVRVLICISLTALVAGLIGRITSETYVILVISTIAAAFFSAVFLQKKKRIVDDSVKDAGAKD